MTYNIYSTSPRAVLELMESSTGHEFYRGELMDLTGFSGPTIDKIMDQLCVAGFVRKEKEPTAEDMNRAPRMYHELTPHGLAALRLLPKSE